MSNANRKRTARGRIQPYAWLGAGAVTLGPGAAMVGGTAVAFAETGNDSGNTSTSSEKPAGDSPSSASTKTERRAAHSGARGNTSAGSDNSVASTHRNRPSDGVDVLPSLPDSNKPLPAAVAAGPVSRAAASTPAVPAPAADSAPTVDVPAPAKAADPAPAGAVAPAASDTPSTTSWLPDSPIVPGAHVKLAQDQITASQASLKQATSGNILASLGSFGPQAALATAQALLGLWASTIEGAQKQVADTVGQPLIHNIAQARLQNELTYTKLAGLSLQTASALITPLALFGADVAPTKALVDQAQQNGKVYAKVPVQMVAGTEPVVKAKLNGGSNAKLLVDTGASGIVTTRDKIGNAALGSKTGEGNSCFSGGLCYHFDTYDMTVDLGDGASATAPVNIVTDTAEYPDSVKNFKDFFSWGADGILGVGVNTEGPGPKPIPTAAMPGELSDGVLIYQKPNLFGGGSYLVLGPNLFPTKVSLPGAPDAYVKVSVNGGPKQDGAAIIDSGGVYGTLNRSFMPGTTGDNVPAGTKIDVYTADGSTLLYSYTTKSGTSATPFIDSGLFNTGNAPYAQNPIYLNYGTDPYTGYGSTDFSIY